jgi:hypothetical protein
VLTTRPHRPPDSNQNIRPFSVIELVNNPKILFAALANAGWNAFTSKAQADLLNRGRCRIASQSAYKQHLILSERIGEVHSGPGGVAVAFAVTWEVRSALAVDYQLLMERLPWARVCARPYQNTERKFRAV